MGQTHPSLRFVETFDEDLDDVVDGDRHFPGLRVRELAQGNAAFALVSDVYKHLIRIHRDDGSLNDFAFPQGL